MRIFEYMFVWIGAYLSDIEGVLSVHMREQQKNGAGDAVSNSVVQLKANGKQKKKHYKLKTKLYRHDLKNRRHCKPNNKYGH